MSHNFITNNTGQRVFWDRVNVYALSFYIDIEGIKELHEDLKAKNLQITELKTTWYGMQEFYLKDINGYILGFAETAE